MTKKVEITINGKTYTVEVGDLSASPVQVVVNGQTKSVSWREAPAAPVAAAAPAGESTSAACCTPAANCC